MNSTSGISRFGFVLILLLAEACSSGKAAFEHGRYYEAVMTSVNRLKRNSDQKKSTETLRQAYPLAVQYHEGLASDARNSNAQFKWGVVVQNYVILQTMYDEIQRTPGALAVIPNPVNYSVQLAEARQNAAEEKYAAGLDALNKGGRDNAKQAYAFFTEANEYVAGYKDVVRKIEDALWAATLKVVVEPIPVNTRSLAVSADFFNDRMSEYLRKNTTNKFVRFFSPKEAQALGVNADHIVKMEFDDFAVGSVYFVEKEVPLSRDSVVVATTVTGPQDRRDAVVTTGNQNTTKLNNQNTVNTGNQNPSNPDTGNVNPVQGKQVTDDPSAGNVNQGNPNQISQNQGNQNQGNQNQGNQNQGNQNQGDQKQANQDQDKSNNSVNPVVPVVAVETQIDPKDQVTICHIPPGNDAARHTVVVSRSALKAHLDHGDSEGSCEDLQKKEDEKKKADENKAKPADKPKKKDGTGSAFLTAQSPEVLIASAGSDSYRYFVMAADTNKVYATVRATYYYSRKTVTSNGVVNFTIIDARTRAALSAAKFPGEHVWVSEWATFNGDERALTPAQLAVTRQKELMPPSNQDLFAEFTKPIFDQITIRIKEFYQNY
jgi:hypothetical protein